MRKLFIAAIAVVALTLPLLADTRTNEVDGVTWQYTVTDGKATLGRGGIGPYAAIIGTSPTNIDIPAEVGGCPVVDIARYAFYSGSMTSITIPAGVTNISSSAFSYCTSLKNVVIPSTVRTIDNGAFAYCYALTNVTMEEGVANLVGRTFQGCNSLESIVIPSTVAHIGSLAFHNCSKLLNVTFAGDRDVIDMYILSVFEGTPWVEAQPFELIIDPTYNTLDGFLGICPETVTIPEGVRSIYSSFSDYSPSVTNLVSVTLPSSLRFIGSGSFAGCSNLRSISIPQGVYSIEQGAFRECSSLQEVIFEDNSRAEKFYAAFKGTPFFDSLPFRLRINWRVEDGWDAERCYVADYIGKCPDNLDIEAVHVAQWEADRQRTLEETGGYDIGEAPAIKGIAHEVFAGCNIKSVVLPESLSAIENGAFFDCTNMTRIVFTGNAPEEIAEDAFYVYEEVYYDEWGNWVPEHYGANANCMVYVPANSTGWGVDIPGAWRGMRIAYSTAFNVEGGVLVSVVAGEDTELTVPAGVTNIAANAFAGCSGLERLTIPDAVESIDPTAFAGCGKLWAKWFKTLERLSDEDAGSAHEVALTVTNVVVHYVTQSVPSEAVVPQETTGIVSVIGEVRAGAALAIPAAWAEQYGAAFTEKFGSDFAKAVTAETGKRDGAGNAMFVWQDFVAGTDPTGESDVFTASITFDAMTNEPIISWTPELPASEAAKRTYKTFGKVRLTDDGWALVNGNASAYNFFKVTVEMK